MAEFDMPEALRTRTDQHAAANRRMPVGTLIACPTQRPPMQDRDVIANDCGFAHHQTGGMVKEDALSDAGSRVDIRLEYAGRAALQVKRKIPPTAIEQPMREAMRLQRMKPLEIQDGFHEAQASGIAVINRLDIDA